MNKERLVWIDLETTGLKADEDQILEIGCIITDASPELREVARTNIVVGLDPYEAPSIIDVSETVLEMHVKSGLWKLVRQSEVSIEQADTTISEFIERHGGEQSPACGSSIHFDRKFMAEHLPEIEKALHYRNIDVSSIRNTALYFDPGTYGKSPYVMRKEESKEPAHRAIDDIEFSIEEYRFFLSHWLGASS